MTEGPIEEAKAAIAKLENVTAQWKGRYNSHLSVSAGAASNRDHDTIESITAEADKNMYECKRNYYISRGVDRRRR